MVLGNPFSRGHIKALTRDAEKPFQEDRFVQSPSGVLGPPSSPPEVPKFETNGYREELHSSLDLNSAVMLMVSGLSGGRLDDNAKGIFRDRLVETLVATQGHESLASEFARPKRRLNETLIHLLKEDSAFSMAMELRAPDIVSALAMSAPAIGRDGGGRGFGD